MEDKRYLISLIKEGEHQQQDFKYRVSDACKLAKSVSAFANTDGGRLLIGVRDDGHLSGVRLEGRTIVIATVPPSDKRPVFAIDEDGKTRAYIRIADENIVASPVLLTIWRDVQKQQGIVMTYTDTVRKLLDVMTEAMTLNQLVRRSGIPRPKVITLLARLVRFGVARWEYIDQQFLFSQR